MGETELARVGNLRCLNCEAEVVGAHCTSCGQAVGSPVVPLRDFVRESVAELLSWDGTQLRTIRALVTKPGLLTAEYLAGRRVSYVHPVRLFAEMGVATYLITRVIPTDFDLFGVAPELFGEDVPLSSWLATVGLIAAGVATHWIALRRERPMVMEHAVFLLHVLAFSFLLAPIEGLLYLASSGSPLLGAGSFLVAPAVISGYWLVALRRFLNRHTLGETYVSALTVYGLFLTVLVVVRVVGYLVGS